MALLKPKDKAEMAERAAERRKINGDLVREQIQVSSLVNVLQQHAMGKGRMKMPPSRLKAIEMLLERSMPTLASVKHEVEAKSVVFNMTTSYVPQKK